MSWFSRLFKQPEAFINDPYGYLTNQISHIYLGFLLCTAYVFFVWKATGFHPDQFLCVAVVVAGYAILWEALYQHWRGWDSIEDTLYVFCGAGSFLFIDYQFVITRVFVWLLIISVALCIGLYARTRDIES